jgi:hypothetical protein
MIPLETQTFLSKAAKYVFRSLSAGECRPGRQDATAEPLRGDDGLISRLVDADPMPTGPDNTVIYFDSTYSSPPEPPLSNLRLALGLTSSVRYFVIGIGLQELV